VIQPVALGERIVTLQSSLRRCVEAMARRAPPPDETAIEWWRALEEARSALAQHEAFEKPPR